MSLESLCLELAKADEENEVIELLKKEGYWNEPNCWRYYGDRETNFATIGNQQSRPDTALVEKITNSVDAVLIRECLVKGINPESNSAPKSIKEALTYFFGIKDGKLSNLEPKERTRLATNIIVLVTGQKSNPSYSVIDKGEGQTPQKMPSTFLSLDKANKFRIPFVQGKFNMGGSGAFQFCGKQNLQLIITKRQPEIANKEKSTDPTADYWGFTIMRRENPQGSMRNSVFTYLAPSGNILKFKANTLPLLPGAYPKSYENKLEWGSLVKLYNYQLIPRALLTSIYFDFYYHFCVLLPNIALPILLYERRPGYTAQSYEITLSGLSVRLEEDKKENLEEGFPSSANIKIEGQEIKTQIFAFKREKMKKYATQEGVIFTINGQCHGNINRSFFSQKSVGMDYLSDSILVIADCSNFEGRIREDLFMNSRDRLRESKLKLKIESELAELISNHQGLRELKERRRREEIEDRIGDDRPLVEVIEKVIKKSPILSKLLIEGIRITNPFITTPTGIGKKFIGKKFPTFFSLKNEFPNESPKICHQNLRFRVQFETDAENEYLTRDTDPGEFKLLCNGVETNNRVLNLWNGIANLTVLLPYNSKVNDLLHYELLVSDISRTEEFYSEFYVIVIEPINIHSGKSGERKPPRGNETKNGREKPSLLSLPNIIGIRKKDWDNHGFDKQSALKIRDGGDSGYDFYINLDNIYLLSEIKNKPKLDPAIIDAQYKYGLVLIGLSLLHGLDSDKDNSNEEPVFDKIFKITKAISPVLIPMITSLNDESIIS